MKPHGDQHHAASNIGIVLQHEIKIGEFDGHFPLVFSAFTCRAVFELKLGVH